jgi:hypothetical protein
MGNLADRVNRHRVPAAVPREVQVAGDCLLSSHRNRARTSCLTRDGNCREIRKIDHSFPYILYIDG